MAMEVDADGRVTELEADLQELKAMLMLSKREAVRQELERMYSKLEAELEEAKANPHGCTAAPASKESKVEEASKAPPAAPPAAASAAPSPPPAAAAAAPAKAPEPAHKPVPVVVKTAGPWSEITTFAQDLGSYNTPQVTIDVRLKGVETLPAENVTCDFTEASFDLKIIGLDGTNYRFLKTNLDKDIVPSESSVKVKKNHVIITLQKVKGEYGYDTWADLCAKGRRKPAAKKGESSNPQDSIMDMMKDLYEDGDDSMKKIIGEAMYKARKGEKYEPKAEDMKMPSLDDDI